MQKNSTLGLCMIVKNEGKNLPRCLDSVKAITDEIIITDTGSTDDTVAIARSYGAILYEYAWTDSFADARNFCLKKSSCDWILLLDADEELSQDDHDKLISFINTTELDGCHFNIINYMEPFSRDNYTLHNGLRLVKNHRGYSYAGEIHEQLVNKDGKQTPERFAVTDIRLYHYGYLHAEVDGKGKRKRNIPLLEKHLQQNPHDGITLFYLGNEYLSMEQYAHALEYYRRAHLHMDVTQAYAPHLFMRMINCLDILEQYDTALEMLEEALRIYPDCTDMYYVKGLILQKCRRYTLAIDSFQKCFEQGDSPLPLRFFDGCASYRPAQALGELFFELCDYQRALEYFQKTLNALPTGAGILYRIGASLAKLLPAGEQAQLKPLLYQYFANAYHEPNALVAADILIQERQYALALRDMEEKNKNGDYTKEFSYLSGKASFYLNRYEQAAEAFHAALEQEHTQTVILPHVNMESAKYLFSIALISDYESIPHSLKLVKTHCDADQYAVCDALALLAAGEETSQSNTLQVSGIACILDHLLGAKELTLFDRLLPILHRAESNKAGLCLAELYSKHGFPDLAIEAVLRSVKESDTLDATGVSLLCKSIVRNSIA